MAQMIVNGVSLFVDQDGVGPPLILVHGLGDESGLWAPVVAALRDRFSVVRYDLRGHGLSGGDWPDGAPELALPEKDLSTLLDRLGIESAHYVGHDLGGAIVQRLAFTSPGRARTLVLESTLPAPLGGDPPALPGVDEQDRADRPLAAADRLPAAPVPVEGARRLSAISCPTLIVAGELDGPAFQHGAELLHGWIPNSRLVRIEGARHAPHIEQPARFLDHLRAFLAEFG